VGNEARLGEMTTVIVRQLRQADDLSQACALLCRFFSEEGFVAPVDVIAQNLRAMVMLDVCAVLVAETDGVQVGIATLSMDFGIEYGWSGEMGDLYVLPEWRGRGLSRKLVDAVEQALRQKGAKGYQVTVTPMGEEHHELKRLYQALGFSDEGRTLFYKMLD
jgi:GNAT superfamily N-acetyltransferase